MGATARYLRNAVNNAFFLRSAGVSKTAGRLNLQEYLDRQSRDLGSFADQMGQTPSLDETSFQEKAVRLLREAPVFSAIAFLNDNFRREWVFPFAASRGVRGTELKGPSDAMGAAKRALKTGQPAASGLVDLLQGGNGVQLYAPVFQGSVWQGLVKGPFGSVNWPWI